MTPPTAICSVSIRIAQCVHALALATLCLSRLDIRAHNHTPNANLHTHTHTFSQPYVSLRLSLCCFVGLHPHHLLRSPSTQWTASSRRSRTRRRSSTGRGAWPPASRTSWRPYLTRPCGACKDTARDAVSRHSYSYPYPYPACGAPHNPTPPPPYNSSPSMRSLNRFVRALAITLSHTHTHTYRLLPGRLAPLASSGYALLMLAPPRSTSLVGVYPPDLTEWPMLVMTTKDAGAVRFLHHTQSIQPCTHCTTATHYLYLRIWMSRSPRGAFSRLVSDEARP